MPRVFVTDGRAISALSLVRSLGQTDPDVTIDCGDTFSPTITATSRYVSENYTYPSPDDRPEKWLDWLVDHVHQVGYDLLLPVRDASTALLATNRDRLPDGTGVFLADGDLITRFRDKALTMKIATEHDVPIPRTYFPDEVGLEHVRSRADFPVLVKPRDESGSRGIRKVDSGRDLEPVYERVTRDHESPIVQEYVSHDGGHYSLALLFDGDSEVVATHAYRETSQYPASGGPAVAATTVPVGDWADPVIRMLGAEGWIGPAHADVLFDPETSTYRLLEINPRYWTSIALTIGSGVDIPRYVYELALDGETHPDDAYDAGREYRWVVPGQLLAVTDRADTRTALGELVAIPTRNTSYAVLSCRDPLPVVGVGAQSMQFLLDPERRAQMFGRNFDV